MRSCQFGLLAALICGLLGAILSTGSAAAQSVRGTLTGDVVWTGSVDVDGDVEIPVGSTLSIRPGTEVRIAARDATQAGWDKQRVEIHVHGSLRVQGAPDRPVVIGPAGGGARELTTTNDVAAWFGVTLHDPDGKGGHDDIRHARFTDAVAALRVPNGAPTIVDCVFVGCKVGAEVGAAYRDDRNHGAIAGDGQPEFLRCRFAGCYTGIFVEGAGSPDVLRSVFYRCRVGVGCRRPGYYRRIEEPGAVIEHCAMLHNEVGVLAPAIVQDSILAWNQTAMAVSVFHAPLTVSIDQIASRTNLLFENKTSIKGEIGIDNEPVLGDPQFVGPLETLSGDGRAVLPCLELEAKSPARGVASDGSDIGPAGNPGIDQGGARWRPQGVATMRVLALRAAKRDQRKRPTNVAAGQAVGKGWWSMPPKNGDLGIFDLRKLFGDARAGWFAAPVTVAAAADVAIELNGDLDQFSLQWDGKVVAKGEGKQRFGERGTVHTVTAEPGEHWVVVRVHGWTEAPKFGVALKGAQAAPIAPLEAAALTVRAARLKRPRRGPAVVQVKVDGPLNWSDSGLGGRVEIRRPGAAKALVGSAELRVEIVDRQTLLVLDPPAEWRKPMTLMLSGLRRPDGTVYDPTASVEVR